MSLRRKLFAGLPAVAVVLAATFSARAGSISLTSAGLLTEHASSGISSGAELVVAESGVAGLSSLSYSFDSSDLVAGMVDGTGVFSGKAGTLDFTFSYDPSDVISAGSVIRTVSTDGTFTLTGGTGDFADATGGGTVEFGDLFVGRNAKVAVSGTSLIGSLEMGALPADGGAATPLPRSAVAGAALLGVLGVLRMRRAGVPA